MSDVRKWFYYPIEMPLTCDGQGPATVGVDAASISYEVWDILLNTHSSHDNLPDAINEAMRLNALLNENEMSDEELVKRLREDQPVTQDMASTMQCALQDEAADRIEALTEQLKTVLDREAATTARYDAKLETLTEQLEALTAKNEMLGREVNIARYGQPDFAWSVHVQAMDDLNAKLEKAVKMALEECPFREGTGSYNDWWHDRRTTLAEIEGEKE